VALPPLVVPVEIPRQILPSDPVGTAWQPPDNGFVPGQVTVTGSVTSPIAIGTAPVDARIVEEQPELLSHPELRYPEVLRQAGIEGRVVVETVLDSLGHPEAGSLRVLTSTHLLFDREALDVVQGSRYRPGRIAGRAVRVRVQVPVTFEIRR
jgi:TonB family protein